MNPFAETIRSERLLRKMTQKDLAVICGSSVPHISKMETGRERPGQATIARLAEALDLNPHELSLMAGRPTTEMLDAMASQPRRFAALLDPEVEAPPLRRPSIIYTVSPIRQETRESEFYAVVDYQDPSGKRFREGFTSLSIYARKPPQIADRCGEVSWIHLVRSMQWDAEPGILTFYTGHAFRLIRITRPRSVAVFAFFDSKLRYMPGIVA